METKHGDFYWLCPYVTSDNNTQIVDERQ